MKLKNKNERITVCFGEEGFLFSILFTGDIEIKQLSEYPKDPESLVFLGNLMGPVEISGSEEVFSTQKAIQLYRSNDTLYIREIPYSYRCSSVLRKRLSETLKNVAKYSQKAYFHGVIETELEKTPDLDVEKIWDYFMNGDSISLISEELRNLQEQ